MTYNEVAMFCGELVVLVVVGVAAAIIIGEFRKGK
jgi:hypothetical protein